LHRPSRKRHPWSRPDIDERTTDESITTEQVPEDEAILEAKVDGAGCAARVRRGWTNFSSEGDAKRAAGIC
jgi:hypothetical protein